MVHFSPTTVSSSLSTTAPESLLVRYVKAHVRKGEQAKERADQAREKAEQHFIAAGQYLTTLKVNYAPSWQHWEALLRVKVGLSTGRASELMQLADGRKDLQQIRDEKAQSVARLRAHRSSLQPDVVKRTLHNEEEDKQEGPARVATAPDRAHSALGPSDNENDPGPSINDPRPLLNALALSTPIARKLAVAAVVSGIRQHQFEQVSAAVIDLYTQLAKAGR